MRLAIFYPGGVSYGTLSDESTNDDILDLITTAITVEEGNGNGRIRKRNSTVDERTSD